MASGKRIEATAKLTIGDDPGGWSVYSGEGGSAAEAAEAICALIADQGYRATVPGRPERELEAADITPQSKIRVGYVVSVARGLRVAREGDPGGAEGWLVVDFGAAAGA